ncbi:polyhomeotic-like protein 1 [Narcine bancroftii]|uniref:polyhomeotic-like protein 1 n=1 Tax=Narcine bancroftii TaxID=1343680 RepID=UPI003831CD23
MENEAEASSGTGGSGSTSRPPVSQMSLYERQAVQALQALHRQPNAAAQYLQQMYAAQHQQLILQQHLSSAQLQNLAAVHQVTLAANRQVTSGSGGETQSGGTAQSTVNLSTSPATQGGVRPHTASSPVTSVLLNPTGTSSLSPTQAKMYLQAQVVARTLTRTAPLTHQLILMPGGSVTAVQTDGSSTGAGTHCESEAQNLAVRGQPSSATKPLPLSLNQPIPGPTAHPSAGPGQPLPSAKVGPIPHGEGEAARASSYTQIQPHGLIQHHHQHLNLPTHRQPHLHLPQPHTQTLVVQPLTQALSEALKQSPDPVRVPKTGPGFI